MASAVADATTHLSPCKHASLAHSSAQQLQQHLTRFHVEVEGVEHGRQQLLLVHLRQRRRRSEIASRFDGRQGIIRCLLLRVLRLMLVLVLLLRLLRLQLM